jgi:hypothetical protein
MYRNLGLRPASLYQFPDGSCQLFEGMILELHQHL